MVTGSSELLQHAQGARCSDSPGVLQNFYITIFLKNSFGKQKLLCIEPAVLNMVTASQEPRANFSSCLACQRIPGSGGTCY